MNVALIQEGLLDLCPQSLPDGWPVAAPARTNRTLISHCANQRAAEARVLPFHRCEVSGCVHKRSTPVWSGRSCSISRPLYRSHTASPIVCFFLCLFKYNTIVLWLTSVFSPVR